MKIYEKPTLVMMSISGNDLLCSCQVDAVEPNADKAYLATIDTLRALGKQPFDGNDNSCTGDVGGYCKFTSSQIIYNS